MLLLWLNMCAISFCVSLVKTIDATEVFGYHNHPAAAENGSGDALRNNCGTCKWRTTEGRKHSSANVSCLGENFLEIAATSSGIVGSLWNISGKDVAKGYG